MFSCKASVDYLFRKISHMGGYHLLTTSFSTISLWPVFIKHFYILQKRRFFSCKQQYMRKRCFPFWRDNKWDNIIFWLARFSITSLWPVSQHRCSCPFRAYRTLPDSGKNYGQPVHCCRLCLVGLAWKSFDWYGLTQGYNEDLRLKQTAIIDVCMISYLLPRFENNSRS